MKEKLNYQMIGSIDSFNSFLFAGLQSDARKAFQLLHQTGNRAYLILYIKLCHLGSFVFSSVFKVEGHR